MSETYTVRVGRDHLLFSSAHFISFAGHQCEPLHGHNYRAAVEIEAPLDPRDHYVFDFIALTKYAKEIVAALDHRTLLATKNAVIRVEESGDRVDVTYRDREWRFPRDNCVLLPIENTTAELLAKYVAGELLGRLKAEHDFAPLRMSVEVEENVGMSARYEWRADG